MDEKQVKVPGYGVQAVNGRKVTDEWPIDQASLFAFMGRETAEQILTYLPDFFEASTPKVAELVLAAERRDAPAMKMAAHALRGGCAMISMESLVTLCRAVERASELGQSEKAVALAYALHKEYALIQAAYGLPVD